MSQLPEAPHYHYDEKLGNPREAFTPAGVARPEARRPELPGRFVATVEGETMINTMWGPRVVPWRTEAGSPCVILGYWADGTIQVRWPAIVGHYRVEGRFPAWVIAEDPNARMAGGGRILAANDPGSHQGTWKRVTSFVGRLLRSPNDRS